MQSRSIRWWPLRQLVVVLMVAALLAPSAEARPIPGDRPEAGDPVIAPPSARPAAGGGITPDFHAVWVGDSYQGAPLTEVTLRAQGDSDPVSDPIRVTFTNEGPGTWDASTVLAMWDGTTDGPPSSGGLLCHDVPNDWASCGPGVAAWIGYGTVAPGEQGTFEFQIQPAANTPSGATFYLRPAEKVGDGYQWINAQDADGLPSNRTYETFTVHRMSSTPAPVTPPSSSSPGRAPLFVDCQPSDLSCFLVPWPEPDPTAQANLAKLASNGGHLVLDENHKLFVVPAHQNDFVPYPVWAGSYAPSGYELYLCTNCFDVSDKKHEFAHPIVYLHRLGDPVPQELNAHAPADPHDLHVDSSVHFASDLQPRVACDAPCDPADYWRRLGLVLGAPFAAAAFPVLLENWLLPAAGNQLAAIGTAAWTRVATATGLSLPVVEQIVQQLEEGTAPETLGEDAVKVSQELETEATQPTGSQTGLVDPFGTRLRDELRQEVLDSTFDGTGRLRPAVLTDPETKLIIPGPELKNIELREALTADGSNLADWGKYSTGTIVEKFGTGPIVDQGTGATIVDQSGTLSFQVHFYFNRVTGAVDYLYDYKIVINSTGFRIPINVDGTTPP